MITRREAALRLDIPMEMARRNGIPSRLTQEDLDDIDANPPAWLAQSRANRTGKKPVWVHLKCDICGFAESARPKKWWPTFTYLTCADHRADELPDAAAGLYRREVDGIGTRFIGIVDESPVAYATPVSGGNAGGAEDGTQNGNDGAGNKDENADAAAAAAADAAETGATP